VAACGHRLVVGGHDAGTGAAGRTGIMTEIISRDEARAWTMITSRGAFRGWTCDGCNRGVSIIDNPDRLRTRAEFLEGKLPWQ
jgi:hypothetical protein